MCVNIQPTIPGEKCASGVLEFVSSYDIILKIMHTKFKLILSRVYESIDANGHHFHFRGFFDSYTKQSPENRPHFTYILGHSVVWITYIHKHLAIWPVGDAVPLGRK